MNDLFGNVAQLLLVWGGPKKFGGPLAGLSGSPATKTLVKIAFKTIVIAGENVLTTGRASVVDRRGNILQMLVAVSDGSAIRWLHEIYEMWKTGKNLATEASGSRRNLFQHCTVMCDRYIRTIFHDYDIHFVDGHARSRLRDFTWDAIDAARNTN